MEVVGAVSSILAIVTAALQVARGLSNLIGEIKDAPQSLQRLSQELRDLEVIFVQIDQTNFRNSETSLNSAAVEMSVRSCRDELGRLRDLLESLAPKSTRSGIHQRTLQGIKKFFKDDSIGDAINALQSRKLSICLALMANLARFVILLPVLYFGPQLTACTALKGVMLLEEGMPKRGYPRRVVATAPWI